MSRVHGERKQWKAGLIDRPCFSNGGVAVQKKMSDGQRRTIYGMATRLGIYEKGNKDDDLHAIVFRVTGKDSIGKLTERDADLVIGELVKLKKGGRTGTERRKNYPGDKKQDHRPGMITPAQRKAVWFYMYRLEELDQEPSQATRAERLCAIIKKFLRVDAAAREPLRFISFKDAGRLIEVLKNMVRYEEQKGSLKDGELPRRRGGGRSDK